MKEKRQDQPLIANKIGAPTAADERLAKIKHFVRVQSDNQVFVLVTASGQIHVAEVYIDDIATPTRLSRQLLRKKSLILAPCSDTRDGHWPRARWNQLINERMRVFDSRDEMLKWDATRKASDPAKVFAVDDFVRHPRYGIGRVIEVGRMMRRQTVVVEFIPTNRRETFISDKCPLAVVA